MAVVQANHSLFEEIVGITHSYLGPAAGRFVARQVYNHLGKDPAVLQKRDLAQLIDWIGIAMGVLTEDEKLVAQYVGDLKLLTTTDK
jgi:hypothetical protein